MKNFEVSKDLGVKQVIHLNKTDKVFFDDLELNDVSDIELKNEENSQVANFYNGQAFKIASIEVRGKIRIVTDSYNHDYRTILIETIYE